MPPESVAQTCGISTAGRSVPAGPGSSRPGKESRATVSLSIAASEPLHSPFHMQTPATSTEGTMMVAAINPSSNMRARESLALDSFPNQPPTPIGGVARSHKESRFP